MIHNYFIGHKPFMLPENVDGEIIQVGSGPQFSELRDNTGDQISDKNPNYCELTALYWIWKNECPKMKSDDLISINHYRRWFKELKNPENIKSALSEADIILPEFEPYRESVYEQYCIDSGFGKDLERVRQIISELYPDDVRYFDQVMEQAGIHQYNMMIASSQEFSDFCSWIFPILFELEKGLDLSGYNDYQKRIYGFLSERLLNVWAASRSLKISPMKVIQPETSRIEQLRLSARRIRNRLEFQRRSRKTAR